MTFRAIRFLNSVDLILAEDTCNTIHLLRHFQIEKPLRSYHAHNEHKTVEQIVEMIESNKLGISFRCWYTAISDPVFISARMH